ncbi:MAG: TraI domain-containing protein, partial [Rectinema sp.]|nr:TraI domain-containing protein [Rectinema sp.]
MPAIVVPVLSSDEMLERHRALLSDVQSALLETGMPISTVNDLLTGDVSPVRNFARWIGSLPASEGYHDADACGLFRHSLHVVLLMVRQVNRKWSNITALELQKIATAAVIVGLTHDIAKAWFMVAQPTTGGETWNLTKGPLVQERGRGMFVPGTQLSVTHRYGRSTKYLGHEALGAYFISQICPLTLLARVAGLRQSNNIPATLTAGLGTPLYGLDAILREADRTASEDSCTRSERATQSYAVPALGSGSRLDDFISEFRQHARDRKLTVNVYDRKRPFLLVSSTHTLLPVMYGTRSAQHIFFVLFHALRHRISKASASPEVVAFYTGGGGSPDHFLSELVTRARGKQGEQWLVSVPCPGKEPEVEFVVHASHQQGRCLLRSLLMPNRTLWGDIDPFAYYERGSWQIALRSAQQGVIVPAGEYGFQPAPEDTLVPSLSAKPGTVHRTADLAYQLLTIVKDITPD